MSRTFTKLFSSITESTVWCEPAHTRLTWITMLAMADHAGRVWGSIPGLANRARVPLEDCEAAINTFLAPDAYSRTKDHEGRRIEPIDGGWRLLNHEKYRKIRDEESIKESKRTYINERREAERQAKAVENNADCRTKSNAVDRGRANAEAEADTSRAKQDQKTAPKGDDLLAGVDPQVAADFKALRTRLRAPITATAMAGIRREAGKAGLTLQAALVTCCERGWRGFKAEWLNEARMNGNGNSSTGRKLSVVEQVEQAIADRKQRERDAIDGEVVRRSAG